jgi:hypothetical protein
MSKNKSMIKMNGGYILGLRTIFPDMSLRLELVTHFVTFLHKYGLLLCKSILTLIRNITVGYQNYGYLDYAYKTRLTPRPPSRHVPRGQGSANHTSPEAPLRGHHSFASPEPTLGQGMFSGESLSLLRSSLPRTAVSASPEPVSGKKDNPEVGLSRSPQGTGAFNVHTYRMLSCR